MSRSELLRVEGLRVEWAGAPVLEAVSFDVAEDEFVVLMGPNGSGKTTLLRAVAGLDPVAKGHVWLRGRSLDGIAPHRRGIGMLSQDPALLPRRTVWENIAYGLELARRPMPEVESRVDELVTLLHLHGLEERAPTALSGGERQRVALARTLAPGPALVLLDEPFASVDAELRTEFMSEFRDVLRKVHTAALHVTHDREEGLFLGDRVMLLEEGRIAQVGPPAEVYRAPRTGAAARFLGYNVFSEGGTTLAVHPTSIRLTARTSGRFDAEVVAVGSIGRGFLLHLRRADGIRLEARQEGVEPRVTLGETVGVDWTDGHPVG